jgi:hypothetical protein
VKEDIEYVFLGKPEPPFLGESIALVEEEI